MANLILSYPYNSPTVTVSIDHGVKDNIPDHDFTKTVRRTKTASGKVNVRNIGYTDNRYPVNIVLMTYDELVALRNFFENTVKGKAEIFKYQDVRAGTTQAVRFMNDSFNVGLDSGHPYSVKLILRAETPPVDETVYFSSNIVASERNTGGLKTDGSVWAWGDNGSTQIGWGVLGSTRPDRTERKTPLPVLAPTYLLVALGWEHFIVIKDDNTLWAIGENANGQLGDGTSNDALIYTQETSGASNWVTCCGGEKHTLAIQTGGTLWGWGSNQFDQLGIPAISGQVLNTAPVQVGVGTDWASVVSDEAHTAALKTNGTLWMWGDGVAGKLGQGDALNHDAPVQVGSSAYTDVSVGILHTMAVRSDGTLWAWGYNSEGQLGLNDFVTRLSPVQVGVATNWSKVACGDGHTLALKTDGTMWATGRNFEGQLGQSDNFDSDEFEQIGALTTWAAIASGRWHCAAIRDNTLFTWGYNAFYHLGDGTNNNRSFPFTIDDGTDEFFVDFDMDTVVTREFAGPPGP